MVFHPIAASLIDHVELATPNEAAGYLAVVIVWLSTVMLIVLRKLRTTR
jgi:hypothetical protein